MHHRLIFTILLLITSSCYTPFCSIPIENEQEKVLTNYAQQVANRNQLQLISVGNVTGSRNISYTMAFASDKNMTIEEAKKLITPIVSDFLAMLTSDPTMREYAQFLEIEAANPPRPANTCVKIAFWDHNFDRPMPPGLAEVRYEGGTYFYYERDPKTQALKLIHKED